MKKSLNRKIVLTVVFALAATITLYTLRSTMPRKDLIGGTSLIYQLDVSGINDIPKKNLSQKTINVLKKRVDPKNHLNLVWRTQGDTFFEVQIPLPHSKVHKNWENYKKAYEKLLAEKIEPEKIMLWAIVSDKKWDVKEIEKITEGSKYKLKTIKEFKKAFNNFLPYLSIYDPTTKKYDPNYIQYMVKGMGVLEFRVLPTLGHPDVDTEKMQSYVDRLKTKGPKYASDAEYIWFELEDSTEWIRLDEQGNTQVRVYDNEGRAVIVASLANKYYVLASNKENDCLLYNPDQSWEIKSASPGIDALGRRAINFELDDRAGKIFAKITDKNMHRPLCILLDDLAISAPVIQSRISTSGQIMGSFSQEETDNIANKLNAGALPAKLIEAPVSINTIVSETVKKNKHR